MDPSPHTDASDMDLLSTLASALAGVEPSIACAGTALEARSWKVRGKAFLFLGPSGGALNARLKLLSSLAEAQEIGARVGANGWVTVPCGPARRVPTEALRRWVAESYALMAAPRPGRGGSV